MKIEETIKFRDAFIYNESCVKNYKISTCLVVPDEFTEWIENNSDKFGCVSEKDGYVTEMTYGLYPYDISFFRLRDVPSSVVCFLGWQICINHFMDDGEQKHIVVKVWPVYYEYNPNVSRVHNLPLNVIWRMWIFEVTDLDDFIEKVTYAINTLTDSVHKSHLPVSEREKALVCYENANVFTDKFLKCLWVQKIKSEKNIKEPVKFNMGDICRVRDFLDDFEFGDFTITKNKSGHIVRIVEQCGDDRGYIVFDYDSDIFTVVPGELLELAEPELQDFYRYNKK